ncbi:MAG: lectin-like domain-containing protein [Candidatus Kapaibacterium sp.]
MRYLSGDRAIVIGGYVNSTGILTGAPTRETEVIDLNSGAVSPGPSMQYARAEFPTVVLPDGDVLVIGGYSTDGGSTRIERLDVQTMTWLPAGVLQSARRQHAADFLSPDEILIFAGFDNSTAEIYTVASERTRLVSNLPSSANNAVSVNPDARGPSYFGFREGGPNSPRRKTSLRYMKSTDRWEEDLVFDESPLAPRVTALNNGSVVVVGGSVSEQPFVGSKSTWIVNPLGVVRKGPSLAIGRQHMGLGTWSNSRVLTAGGLESGVVISNVCEWIDLEKGLAERAPNLVHERSYAQMIMAPAASGRMRAYVISGLRNGANTPLIELLEDSVCQTRVSPQPLTQMRLAGSAIRSEEGIRLTSTRQYESGSAFVENRVSVRNGFELTFSFRLSEGNDNGMVDEGDPGADGVAVVLLPETPSALGQPGDGIGYHEIPHGIAVEYDSYLNPAYSDPNTSHVAVQVGDGRLLRAWHMMPYVRGVATAGVPRFKADGSLYHGRIVYTPGKLLVYVSTTGVFDEPVLDVDSFDIQQILNLDSRGSCYVGFTSSTGRSSEVHELLSVELTDCQPVTTVHDEQDGSGNSGQMTIMPNPVNSAAHIRLSSPLHVDALLELVDLHGRVLLQRTIPEGSTFWSLDAFSMVVPGRYYVRIITPDKVLSSPLTIVR